MDQRFVRFGGSNLGRSPPRDHLYDTEDDGMGRLFMALLGMLVVGGPMVLFIWHEFE